MVAMGAIVRMDRVCEYPGLYYLKLHGDVFPCYQVYKGSWLGGHLIVVLVRTALLVSQPYSRF